jgi:drug/metabolite transporter (DMT)-like permease
LLYTRLEGLKYLSTSTYFINYRLLSSIWLVFIWIFFFQENISIKEFLWILLGFFIFYLLFEKKTENEKKVDFKKGILYLLFWIILATVSQVLSKYFVINNEDILSLYVYEGIFWTLLTLFISRKEKLKDIIYVPDKRFFSFLILSWGVFTVWWIYNLLAFQKGGDIAIVYKIISYSIFIPIVLSAIFYKEKITLRKIIAFILTILSIALFF